MLTSTTHDDVPNKRTMQKRKIINALSVFIFVFVVVRLKNVGFEVTNIGQYCCIINDRELHNSLV